MARDMLSKTVEPVQLQQAGLVLTFPREEHWDSHTHGGHIFSRVLAPCEDKAVCEIGFVDVTRHASAWRWDKCDRAIFID